MLRKPAVAGRFYPAEKDKLLALMDKLFKEAKAESEKAKRPQIKERLKAIIAPHASYVFSGLVAATAYSVVREHKNDFKDIVVVGPSHYIAFEGFAAPESDTWETPLGTVEVKALPHFFQYELTHNKEHSIEVQIPFLQYVLEGLKGRALYPVVVGDAFPEELASALEPFLDDKLLVVSSDLSHYYPYEYANQLDSFANKCIPNLDVKCVADKVEACGKIGILALLHIAKKRSWKGHFLKYMNSGDVWEDKSSVVGYGAYAFTE